MKITKQEFLVNKNFYLDEIRKGKIFIYPTDTIYGIGCDATNIKSVDRIREIKKRDIKPFSVIVPGKKWIFDNCYVFDETYLDKLPGKFTFILKLKDMNNKKIAIKELIGELDSIGVRIPGNWFAEFLIENNIIFVTSSVNISGEKHVTNLDLLKEEIEDKVDYIIDDGVLDGSPSTIIDLTDKDEKILRK